MELELARVFSTGVLGLSITCLDTWRSKLILGTEEDGILVYGMVNSTGQSGPPKLVADALQQHIRFSHPIKKLNAIEQDGSDLLIVLSGGKIWIYDINCSMTFNCSLNYSLDLSNVENYTLCSDGECLTLCLTTPGVFHIYKQNGLNFYKVTLLDFSYVALDTVLTPNRLFVVYKQDTSSYACGSFDLATRAFVPDNNSYKSQPFLKYFGFDRILLHHESTSELNAVDYKLQWMLCPKAIAVMDNYCVGITDDAIEVVRMQPGGPRFTKTVNTKYITDKSNIFVASADSVWRLVAPFPIDPLPAASKPITISVDHPVIPPPTSFPGSLVPPRFGDYVHHSMPPRTWTCTGFFSAKDKDVSPAASIAVLDLDMEEVNYLAKFGIYSVKELAMDPYLATSNSSHVERFFDAYTRAVEIVKRHQSAHDKLETNASHSMYRMNSNYTPPARMEVGSVAGHEQTSALTSQPESLIEVLGLVTKEIEYFAQHGIVTVEEFYLNACSMPSTMSKERLSAAYELAEAIMSQRQPKVEEPKPKAPLSVHDVNPEDSLQAIGMSEPHIVFMAASMMVFTVRQFAMMSEADVGNELLENHRFAVEVVRVHSEMTKSTKRTTGDEFGYMYLSDAEYAHYVESRTIKSPYILFQEYMECESYDRIDHAWRDVYHRYHDEAVESMKSQDELSDADVLSYLCWKALSIDKLDTTAAARAIFFHMRRAPPLLSTAYNVRDTFDNPVPVNLTSLCKHNGGHLYHKQEVKGSSLPLWSAMTLAEYEESKRRQEAAPLVHIPLDQPQYCIVLPSGTIEACDTLLN